MRILLTGGAGYIGSLLARDLVARGHETIVLDRLLFGRKPVEELTRSYRFRLISGDVRNKGLVEEALKGVEAVIHLAAIVGDLACAADKDLAVDTNSVATLQLAELAKSAGIPRFVFVSTCSVYGAGRDNPQSEESEPSPVSLYAETRLSGERAVLGAADEQLRPTILRLGTVYGCSPHPRFDLAVNYMTYKAVCERMVSILGGDQWRPFVHIQDIGRAIRICLEASPDVVGGQIFNVGDNRENHQLKALAGILRQEIPGTEVRILRQMMDQRSYNVVFNKIEQVLGFRAEWRLADGVREIRDAITSSRIPDPMHRRHFNHQHDPRESKWSGCTHTLLRGQR